MAEPKGTKREVLAFIGASRVVTPSDLVKRFGYTYSYACKKLTLLKRQGLVQDLGRTPSSYRGNWCLTDKGCKRLRYLEEKVETSKELQSHPSIVYAELAPISKELSMFVSAMVVAEQKKLNVQFDWNRFKRLGAEAERIVQRLPAEERPRVLALLFEPAELRRFFLKRLGLAT